MTRTQQQTTTMKTTRARTLLLVAAAATLPSLLASPAVHAQQQVGAGGTALDANNRIGSGGVNTFRPPPTVGVLGNQIVTGSVSNGRGFRGNVPYTDPTAFRGFTGGSSFVANFEKNSVGVGVPNTPPPTPNASTPYYTAEGRFAPPPPGVGQFTANTNAPGYVPAQPVIVQPNDQRLGVRLDAQPTQNAIPKPGELILPGPVDPSSNQQTVFTASPLTGVRQWSTANVNDISYLGNFTGMSQQSLLDRMKLAPTQLQQMREELRSSPITGPAANSPLNATIPAGNGLPGTAAEGPLNNAGNPTPGNSLGQPTGQPLGQPLEAPADPLLSHGPLNDSVRASRIGNAGTPGETDQAYLNRVVGSTPQQQSKQYDELHKRLERYQATHPDTAQAAAQQFNKDMRARAAKEADANNPPIPGPKTPGTPTDNTPGPNKEPGKQPGATGSKNGALPTLPPIKSMTEGVQAKGLRDMLQKAEEQMRAGKFTDAIDQYQAAEAVAPNQPLVWVGRANAELGAAYYPRAEAHLKQAFTTDKALLMAQYDLRTFLGEERLQTITKDLKEIASSDPQSVTAPFLLAYIAYNTGNEARAQAWLDLADKRSGGKDPSYKLLREYWALPTAPSEKTPDLNK